MLTKMVALVFYTTIYVLSSMYLISLTERSVGLTKEYLYDRFSKIDSVDTVKLAFIIDSLFDEKIKKVKSLVCLLNLLAFPITIFFTLYESEDFEQAFKEKFENRVLRSAIPRIEFRLGLK